MFTLPLKPTIFTLLVLVMLLGWLIWRAARPGPLFDKKFRTIWNSSPYGVVLLSSVNRLLFANRQARMLLNLGNEEAKNSVGIQHLYEQIERRSVAQRFTLSVESQTLDVWKGRFGSHQLLIFRDVSVQRQQENEVQALWTTIAHELRTPMTSMLSHLELVRRETTSAEIKAESLDIVQQQAHRLTHLVQNSLELGRLRATTLHDKRLVDMVLVAEEAIAEMILLAERQDNQIAFVSDEIALYVFGDQDKLKQMIINLLDNALKYCLAGDHITVTLQESAESIHCTVADTGNGIAAHHLDRITEQFYRADRQQPGSGLGLAIVQEIVHQHNGILDIDSDTVGEHKGTRVTISLPKETE